LTHLSNAIEDGEAIIAERVARLGASFKNGILTLGDTANLPAIVSTLADLAQKEGIVIQNDLATLADSIHTYLNHIASII